MSIERVQRENIRSGNNCSRSTINFAARTDRELASGNIVAGVCSFYHHNREFSRKPIPYTDER